ncbi:MAG: hypothetical protein GF390_01910 [Candidatus Pacebacteria bacterium]|nr:hypothetical protein [Candidatus Paceibacterota bacterium]
MILVVNITISLNKNHFMSNFTRQLNYLFAVTKLALLTLLLVGSFQAANINWLGLTRASYVGLTGALNNPVVLGAWAPERPTNQGWNLPTESSAANEQPVDLSCGSLTNGGDPAHPRVAHNWTAVSGANIKYQREVTFPDNHIGYYYADNNYTPFASFGSDQGIEGTWTTRVRAFEDNNDNGAYDEGDWASDWSDYCEITLDRTAPYAEITSHDDGDTVSGVVEIRGTVTDDNPHHYWLAGPAGFPGVVNESNSFTDQLLYTWDTTGLAEGEYTLKLEARDAAGNKQPNLAPVPADPEDTTDSVDWVTVTVSNPPTTPSGIRILDHQGTDLGCDGTTDHRYITVDWHDNPEADLAHYDYQIREATTIAQPTESEFSGDIRDEDGLYRYRVRAVDTDDNTSDWTEWCYVRLDRSVLPTPPSEQIVINEVMYDPVGDDQGNMPEGEWVELYNNSDTDVDVAGWYLQDTVNNQVTISASNSDNDLDTGDDGETVVPAHGWLVVYVNGPAVWDNDGDAVVLYNNTDVWQDEYIYSSGQTEGSTQGRDTDGTDNWVTMIATPGRTNVATAADLQPSAYIWQQDEHHARIAVFDGLNYDQVDYEITYLHDQDGTDVPAGLTGSTTINSNNLYINDLFMGTESSGSQHPHSGIKQVVLTATLSGGGLPDRVITVNLSGSWE